MITKVESETAITSNEESTITSNEEMLFKKCQDLGNEIRKNQKKFLVSVKTSFECARKIGEIANDAKECINNLPTKAKLKSQNKQDYKKPTFEQWLDVNTSLSKDTIYAMMKLDKLSKKHHKFEFNDDMSWREALKLLKSKEQDVIDVDAEEVEDEDNIIENEKSDVQRTKKYSLNKLRDKVSKLFEKFLKDPENSEYEQLIAQWQKSMTDDVA